jgi:ankyrin repeat protein
MDTLPLPPRPNLEQYKKRAKSLVRAAGSGDPETVRVWATEWLETLSRLRVESAPPFVQASFDRAMDAIDRGVRERLTGRPDGRLRLADAQFLIARAHGFDAWSTFADHVVRLSSADAGSDPFESAADAIVTGDMSTLAALLRQDPGLIRARSAREHRATLLHYVAANGIEDFRQRTPSNAVAVATALLAAGAEVDALANTYGGGPAQTTMNLLVSSTHPAGAGVQPALIEALLDFDAAINGVADDGSPLMTALAFGYLDAAEALARRGARLDNIIAAAALGRTDLVRRLVAKGGGVAPSLVNLYWLGLSSDPRSHVERALVWACRYGHVEVVELLLADGVDPAAADASGMSSLHWAAGNGHLDIVELLIARGAPLETRNRWGGTVLSTTVYLARQQPVDWPRYASVVERLIAAGADVHAVTYPTGDATVDELLRRHGHPHSDR